MKQYCDELDEHFLRRFVRQTKDIVIEASRRQYFVSAGQQRREARKRGRRRWLRKLAYLVKHTDDK